MAAKDRKRAAVHDLRTLAGELSVPQSRRKTDLNAAEFKSLFEAALAAQRSRCPVCL